VKKVKIVYVISKGKDREGKDKNYWNKIGVAFVNQDGSLNVKLEALPVGGELHIRDAPEWDGQGRHDDAPPSFSGR